MDAHRVCRTSTTTMRHAEMVCVKVTRYIKHAYVPNPNEKKDGVCQGDTLYKTCVCS